MAVKRKGAVGGSGGYELEWNGIAVRGGASAFNKSFDISEGGDNERTVLLLNELG